MGKSKRIKISTVNGPRYLVFKPIHLETEDEHACDHCSYFGKCDKFLNPETPDDKESSFMEFCSDLGIPSEEGEAVDKEILSYIPQEGTLEENISDLADVYQALIKKKGYVSLGKVIDCICKDTCPLYNEEHSNCSSKNSLCLLEDLIKSK